MKTSALSFALFRLAAVFVVLGAFKNLSLSVGMLVEAYSIHGSMSVGRALFGLMLLEFAPIVFAVILWFGAERLSRLAGGEVDLSPSSSSANDYLETGIVLIGVYAVVFGLITCIRIETILLSTEIPEGFLTASQMDTPFIRRLSYIPNLLVGVLLIIGRSIIAQAVHKVRYGGIRVDETVER